MHNGNKMESLDLNGKMTLFSTVVWKTSRLFLWRHWPPATAAQSRTIFGSCSPSTVTSSSLAFSSDTGKVFWEFRQNRGTFKDRELTADLLMRLCRDCSQSSKSFLTEISAEELFCNAICSSDYFDRNLVKTLEDNKHPA